MIKTVYFVDDSDDEIYLSKILFKSQNINLDIEHYSDFDEFYNDVVEFSEDVLNQSIAVIDLNLTLIKGTEGIRRIKNQSELSRMIVGICTGSEDPADRMNAEQVKADFFIPKPLDQNSLSALCETVPQLRMDYSQSGLLEIERLTAK